MIASKKIMYGVALTLCLISLSTVAGMERNGSSDGKDEAPSSVSGHASRMASCITTPTGCPNTTLPTQGLNQTLGAIVVSVNQEILDEIYAHISDLQNMITATLIRRNLQVQIDPENSVYVAQVIEELTNQQGYLDNELQLLQRSPDNMNSVRAALEALDPVIEEYFQRAINRLQILCNNLRQEFNQHEHALDMACRKWIRYIQLHCLFMLLTRVYNLFVPRVNNVHCINLQHMLTNRLNRNGRFFLSLTDLRSLRTNYDATFQRLALMFDSNNNEFMAFQRKELNKLTFIMRVESMMLDVLRQQTIFTA